MSLSDPFDHLRTLLGHFNNPLFHKQEIGRALCFEARCFEATLVVLYVVMAKLLMFIIEFVLPMIYM